MIRLTLESLAKGVSGMGRKGPSSVSQQEMKKFTDDLSDNIATALSKALESPELKRASDNFKTSILGLSEAKTNEEVQFWKKKGTKYSEAYFQSWVENKMKFQQTAKDNGVPMDISEQMFSNKWERPGLQGESNLKAEQKHHMRQFGIYMLGYLAQQVVQSVFEYGKANLMTNAQIGQSTGMAFNYASLTGDYILQSQTGMQNQMQRLEVERMKKGMVGQLGGSVLGLGIGALLSPLTGGLSLPLMSTMGFLGGALGSEIGTYSGTEDITQKMRQQLPQMKYNKLMEQWMGLSGPRMEAYKDFDIADTRTRARLGNIGISGRGLGYDETTLRKLQYGMGSIAGYDKDAFTSQLAFSRAEGLNPEEVFAGNVSTRYTGEAFGASQLARVRNVANTTGMGTRIPEVIQGFNKLAEVFTKLDNKSGEKGILQTASLLNTIYGDTEKGRLSGMGLETFGQLQGMFQQAPGSAGDAFMFSSLQGLHGGNLRKFELLKEQGLTNRDTFHEVLKGIEQYGPEKGYFAFRGLGLSAVMANQLTEKIKTSGGVENVMKEWDQKNTEISENTEDATDVLEQILNEGKEKTPKVEKFQADITDSMKNIGRDIASIWKTIHKMEIDRQNSLVGNPALGDQILNSLTSSIESVTNEVNNILNEKRQNYELTRGYTNEEKDFLWNIMQKEGSEKLKWAKNILGMEGNEKFYHITSYKPSRTDEEIILPFEGRYLKIHSGLSLGDGKSLMIDPIGGKEAELMERDIKTTRQTLEQGVGEGQGKNSNIFHFNVNIDANELDRGIDELKYRIRENLAKSARPYKRIY